MDREQEAVLVGRVAQGDRAAFGILVEQHQRPLSRYARRMLSDVSAADDIVQEAFVRLWTRADSFNSATARLTTWLHNIAHNLCIDSFRRNARLEFTDDEARLESVANGPDGDFEANEKADRVRTALETLPERQRSALLLCHYQGLSNRDAATVLDVSVDALESLLARARRRLKEELLSNDES
ncbi:sigma-70 family RNA polymerase sigma factor [Congregibacter variabilis]|uniref:Sigma-70 family RNA polymerase sigma factor n=1 Tax=Congregibacter variabilis TaxID=3081200 RepID=A0ABZ0HZW2_9GAMM|nr:sigma-70 family RNA polymerase sigma factor [Congregibacter sp. IMCC43200]